MDLREIYPEDFTTLEEFDEAIEFVAQESARISMQLSQAILNKKQYGEDYDTDWFPRAQAACSMAKAKRQTLTKKRAELAKKLKQQEVKQKENSRERKFIEVAKEVLTPAQYFAIWQMVNESCSA